jgi:hypothetical protein
VNLPPIVGPVPAIGDAHLENPEGLGPGLPLNAIGLPSTDPLTQVPLINLGNSETAGSLTLGPLPGPASALPGLPCQVICLGTQAPPPVTADAMPDAPPPWQPPWALPPPPPAPEPVLEAPVAPLPVHGALPGPAS